jgi:hypothetical protein
MKSLQPAERKTGKSKQKEFMDVSEPNQITEQLRKKNERRTAGIFHSRGG